MTARDAIARELNPGGHSSACRASGFIAERGPCDCGMFDKTDRIISALTAAGFSIVPAGEVEAVEAGAECMWAEKPCTCGGGPCEQVSFGENHESLLAELIGEHSGCGHGIQNESIPVKLARGDEVYVVRGELGRALIPATGPVKAFTAAPLSARPKGGA